MFQVRKDTGLWYSAEYSSFSLGPPADFYRLSVSGYSGDAGDALAATVKATRLANGMQFTTPDFDNDNHPQKCYTTVGWWLNACSRSLVNRDINGYWNAATDAMIKDVTDARMLVKLD